MKLVIHQTTTVTDADTGHAIGTILMSPLMVLEVPTLHTTDLTQAETSALLAELQRRVNGLEDSLEATL